MHMLMVIPGGLLLVFAPFGGLWGGDAIATAAKLLITAWIVVALANMRVGVTRAGYMVAQELPVLLLVIAAPMAVAVWQITCA